MAIATLAFAGLHSCLASDAAKHVAARLLGRRRSAAWYRIFFVGHALLSVGLLAAYGAQQPTRTIYRVRGPVSLLFRAGQFAGLALAYRAAREVGFARITGVENLSAWLRDRPLAPAPVAQGPEQGADGNLGTGGPFSMSRHPLNLAGVPIFWCTPHLTTRRLVFNIASTVYFVIGSLHEASRLRKAYGQRYVQYSERGIPFFWPRLAFSRSRHPSDVTAGRRGRQGPPRHGRSVSRSP